MSYSGEHEATKNSSIMHSLPRTNYEGNSPRASNFDTRVAPTPVFSYCPGDNFYEESNQNSSLDSFSLGVIGLVSLITLGRRKKNC